MLQIFDQSVAASALFFGALCWGGSTRARCTNKLYNLFMKAGSVLGKPLYTLELVVERKRINKLVSVMENIPNPLRDLRVKQQSTFR